MKLGEKALSTCLLEDRETDLFSQILRHITALWNTTDITATQGSDCCTTNLSLCLRQPAVYCNHRFASGFCKCRCRGCRSSLAQTLKSGTFSPVICMQRLEEWPAGYSSAPSSAWNLDQFPDNLQEPNNLESGWQRKKSCEQQRLWTVWKPLSRITCRLSVHSMWWGPKWEATVHPLIPHIHRSPPWKDGMPD